MKLIEYMLNGKNLSANMRKKECLKQARKQRIRERKSSRIFGIIVLLSIGIAMSVRILET